MDQVETPEGTPAKSYHKGIDRESAIMTERGEINDLDAILFGSPAPLAALELHVQPAALAESKVRRQDRYLMPALDEPSREGPHLDHGTSLFLEGIIGLHNFQDAHGGIYSIPEGPASRESFPDRLERSRIDISGGQFRLRAGLVACGATRRGVTGREPAQALHHRGAGRGDR